MEKFMKIKDSQSGLIRVFWWISINFQFCLYEIVRGQATGSTPEKNVVIGLLMTQAGDFNADKIFKLVKSMISVKMCMETMLKN